MIAPPLTIRSGGGGPENSPRTALATFADLPPGLVGRTGLADHTQTNDGGDNKLLSSVRMWREIRQIQLSARSLLPRSHDLWLRLRRHRHRLWLLRTAFEWPEAGRTGHFLSATYYDRGGLCPSKSGSKLSYRIVHCRWPSISSERTVRQLRRLLSRSN